MGVTIKYVGPDQYSGVDPETGMSFTLNPGDEVEVSEAKADQVQEDFPDWFEVSGGGKKTSTKAPGKDESAEK